MYIDYCKLGKLSFEYSASADKGSLITAVNNYYNSTDGSSVFSVKFDNYSDESDDGKTSIGVTVYTYMFLTKYKHYLYLPKISLGVLSNTLSDDTETNTDDIIEKHKNIFGTPESKYTKIGGSSAGVFITDNRSQDELKGASHKYGYLYFNPDRKENQYLVYNDGDDRNLQFVYGSAIVDEKYGKDTEATLFLGKEKLSGIIKQSSQTSGLKHYNGVKKKDADFVRNGNDIYHINYNSIYEYSLYEYGFDSPSFNRFKLKGKNLNSEIKIPQAENRRSNGFAFYSVVKGKAYYPWAESSLNGIDPWFQSLRNVNSREYIKTNDGYSEKFTGKYYKDMTGISWPLHILGIDLSDIYSNFSSEKKFGKVISDLFTDVNPKYLSDNSLSKYNFAMKFMNGESASFNWSDYVKSLSDNVQNNIYIDTYAYKRYCNPDFWVGRLLSSDDVKTVDTYISDRNRIFYVLGQDVNDTGIDDSVYNPSLYTEYCDNNLKPVPAGDELILLCPHNIYNHSSNDTTECDTVYTLSIHTENMNIEDIQDIQLSILPTKEIQEEASYHPYYRMLVNELTVPDMHSLITPELEDLLYKSNIDIDTNSGIRDEKMYNTLFGSIVNINQQKRNSVRRNMLAKNNLYDITNIADDFVAYTVNVTNNLAEKAKKVFVTDENDAIILNDILSEDAVKSLISLNEDGSSIDIDTNISIKGISNGKVIQYIEDDEKLDVLKDMFEESVTTTNYAYETFCYKNSYIEYKREYTENHRFQAMYFFPVKLTFKVIFDKDYDITDTEEKNLNYTVSKGEIYTGGRDTYKPTTYPDIVVLDDNNISKYVFSIYNIETDEYDEILQVSIDGEKIQGTDMGYIKECNIENGSTMSIKLNSDTVKQKIISYKEYAYKTENPKQFIKIELVNTNVHLRVKQKVVSKFEVSL